MLHNPMAQARRCAPAHQAWARTNKRTQVASQAQASSPLPGSPEKTHETPTQKTQPIQTPAAGCQRSAGGEIMAVSQTTMSHKKISEISPFPSRKRAGAPAHPAYSEKAHKTKSIQPQRRWLISAMYTSGIAEECAELLRASPYCDMPAAIATRWRDGTD